MAKPTKRERKFKASGGVKRRLEKGTITNKGKLRKRSKGPKGAIQNAEPTLDASDEPKSVQNDFLGKDNIAGMDLDSFFEKAVEEATRDTTEARGSSDDGSANADGSSDSSEDAEAHGVKISGKVKANFQEDDSSDDSDDDDDVEEAEARMKAEMQNMQEIDPEFHGFLQENEQELLEFGEDEDDDGNLDEPEEIEETEANDQSSRSDQVHLTRKVLASLEKGVFRSHGLKSLKKLMLAYKSACHLSDASDQGSSSKLTEHGFTYVIDSSHVFDGLMMMCLERTCDAFNHHLVGQKQADGDQDSDLSEDENTPLNPKKLENADKWTELRPIIMSFFRSTLHVLSEAKEPELLTFILKSLSKYVRYLTAFPKMAEAMLKSMTALWSAPLDTSEDYQVVRIHAFFRIRQLALTQPFPFIESCLKKTYLAYARRAKFGTAAAVTSVLPTLTFMGNCLVELYSLDYHSSYQHAFVYVRQLALLLRTAMQKKTHEALQQVYCWQYIHCLKLWTAVLSSSAQEEDGALMRTLVYPLTEVILGTIRHVPSPTRHLPLRFHCVRLLQQLASSTEVFIPTAALMLDALDWKEWYISPKKSKTDKARGTQMQYLLRLPKDDTLRTHEQLDMAMNEFFLLLNREVELYRFSAGFPEFSIRIVQRLRVFSKEVKNPRWRSFAKTCIDTCERYAASAVQERSKLQQAPKDVKLLECLRPASVKTMRERHEESIQKEQKALDSAARKPASTRKKDGEDDQHLEKDGERPRKKSKKDRKPQTNNVDSAVKHTQGKEVLEQMDSVQEGINWSDDESE